MRAMIISDTYATLVFDDGKHATVYNSDPKYAALTVAVKDQDWEAAREVCFPVERVEKAFNGPTSEFGAVSVRNGIVFYNDEPVHDTLANRIIKQLDGGFTLTNLPRFLERVMQNPSFTARKELYLFVEASGLPITEDGYLLAYKRVRTDWKDHYSGTMDNSIGKIVEMDRNLVDDNRSNHCSSGLHFCSRSYLPSYGCPEGGHVIVVKIDPKDVVSIPSDYNNAKGRTCRYEVLYELPLEETTTTAMPTTKLEGLVATYRGEAIQPRTERALVATSSYDEFDVLRFKDVAQASEQLMISASAINRVLRGDRKSTGGYFWKWEYVTPWAAPQIAKARYGDDDADDDFWEDGDDDTGW